MLWRRHVCVCICNKSKRFEMSKGNMCCMKNQVMKHIYYTVNRSTPHFGTCGQIMSIVCPWMYRFKKNNIVLSLHVSVSLFERCQPLQQVTECVCLCDHGHNSNLPLSGAVEQPWNERTETSLCSSGSIKKGSCCRKLMFADEITKQ